MFDLIIIGGGPAGVSAALYAVRANINVLIIENGPNALAKAHYINNYYNCPISGKDMYYQGLQQAHALGAKILNEEVLAVEYTDTFIIKTKHSQYLAKAVILATGTKNKTLEISGLKKLEGKGISYCAVCDGFFFRNKKIAVLGSGLYAMHEAEYLSHLSQNITVLTNGASPDLAKQYGYNVISSPVISVNGELKLESITFSNNSKENFDGLFIALGTADSSDIARKLGAELNGRFIAVQNDFSTNIPGLFAAGDCTGGFMQVAKAVYEGSLAATSAIKYLRGKN